MATMSETAPQPTLLDELDERQDEVLAQLDELNERIERLLAEYTMARGTEMPAASC
jgi:hypothetical protein